MLKNLRDFMYMREVTQEQVAAEISCSETIFKSKLSEFIPFTLDEAKAIRDKFFPGSQLNGPLGVFESDGDVQTERERLHHYAGAIGNSLNKDGIEPGEEADEIVKLFHDCADAVPPSCLFANAPHERR